MKHFNLKQLIIFSFFIFFSLALTQAQAPAQAQDLPSFEVCESANCEPIVTDVKMITHNNGEATGGVGTVADPLLFNRGSLIRIHANITDPSDIKYARAVIKDNLDNHLVYLPLSDDGEDSHGDASESPNGSDDGAADDIYSNLWNITFHLEIDTLYYLYIEAADNFGHTFKSSPQELVFQLTDSCLSTCPTLNDLQCFGNVIKRCELNPNGECNVFQSFDTCMSSDCCGNHPNVGCCPMGQSCANDGVTCITCDNSCNNICSHNDCPPSKDPDCFADGSGGGRICCGDNECEGTENPSSCSNDCPDNTGPSITIPATVTPPTVVLNGAIFLLQAQIIDDYSGIRPNPSATVTDSFGATVATLILLDDGGGGGTGDITDDDSIYTATVNTSGWDFGDYFIEIQARDNSPAQNLTVETDIHTFTISCMDECNTVGSDVSCNNDNTGRLSCVLNAASGCNELQPSGDCTSGPCYMEGQTATCCNNNCDPITFTPYCDGNDDTVFCIEDSNGCHQQETTNCGVDICELDINSNPTCCPTTSCAISDTQCNGNSRETCTGAGGGCPYWDGVNLCTGGEICQDDGSIGDNCCTQSCTDAQATQGTASLCNGTLTEVLDCTESSTTGCNSTSFNQNCDFGPFGGSCWMNGPNATCCSNDCNIGSAQACSDSVTLSGACTNATPDGCNDWGTTIDCGLLTYNTFTGECRNGSTAGDNCCVDHCLVGQTQCNTANTAIETCQLDTALGCNRFVESNSCNPGETCKDSGATPTCCDDTCSSAGNNVACEVPGGAGWVLDCAQDVNDCFSQSNSATYCTSPAECNVHTSTGVAACCTDDCQAGDNSVCLDQFTLSGGCNPSTEADGCYDWGSATDCSAQPNGYCRERTDNPGNYNCCQNTCSTENDTQCNSNNLETCTVQADGCLAWTITDNCSGQICQDDGTNGPNCCTQTCTDGQVGDSYCTGDSLFSCTNNSATGCNAQTLNDDCSDNGIFGGMCDDVTFASPFCCSHECTNIRCGGTGNVQISTCQPPGGGDICDDETFQNCGTGTCHTGSSGANCCQDEACTLGDTQCNGTNTAIETCQINSVTGCREWVTTTACTGGTPTCYDTPAPAYCDFFDDSPPVITLNYPSVGYIFYRGNESAINFLATITDASDMSVGNPPTTYIQSPDGTNISTLTLYDDGSHNDGSANNDQYGTSSWNLTSQPLGTYYIDIFAEDNKGNNIYANNIGNFTIALKPDGMACGGDSECVSDICCAGTCGEGWKTNGESCSLNCECEGGLCDSGICKTPLYLYYSTSTSTGNIGGRPGADGICKAGGGPSDIDYGTVHAFISINSSSEIRDLPSLYGYDESAPVYYGATKIANNYADLLDGRITQEDGLNDAFLLTSHWWSFSTNSGAIDSNTCSGGTDASMSSRGAKGRDGIVSAAHCTGSPGSYDEWAIRSVCTGGYSLPCVNSYRLLCIGELGLPCENDSECGGGCCIDGICNGDNNLTWPGSTHTECDCLALGGTVFGAASGSFCKLNQQNVPAGWAQANNWQKYGGNMNGSGDVCGHYQSYSYPTDWADEACYIQYCRGSQKPVGGANTCGQCGGGSWCDWSGGYSRGIWYVKLAPECGSCGISDRIGVGIR